MKIEFRTILFGFLLIAIGSLSTGCSLMDYFKWGKKRAPKPVVRADGTVQTDKQVDYGTSSDLKLAKELWEGLKQQRLVGEKTITAVPHLGFKPHGKVLETFSTHVEMEYSKGDIWLQRNYHGQGINRSRVAKMRDQYLKSISVMYRMTETYNPKHQNIFWVEYTPEGQPMVDSHGKPMAGRLGQGQKNGCISCHSGAPGGDYVFSNTSVLLDRMPSEFEE